MSDPFGKTTLYIPQGLKVNAEIFEGFGKGELAKALLCFAVMFGISAVVFFFSGMNIALAIIVMLVGMTGVIMCLVKDGTGMSVVDYVTFIIGFSNAQKKYRYVYQKEDDYTVKRYD